MTSRILVAFLALLMSACVLLCACTPAADIVSNDTASEADDISAESTESEAEFPYADHEKFDTTITIFTVNTARHSYGELQFVPDDESSYGQVSAAVAERNNQIEERYGIKIKVESESYPTDKLKTLIEGGACTYDLVCDSVDRMVAKVSENLFWPIDDYVDLSNPWWDSEAIDAITLSDSHYFLAGDALITDDDNTYLTLFNKKIYDENTAVKSEFGDLYQLVRDHKFTIDAYYTISKAVSQADTSGAWSVDATYGNLSHAYGATIMVNGAGESLAKKNPDGTVSVNVMNQRAVDVFGKVYELMSDTSVTTRAELLIGKIAEAKSTYGFAELGYMFENGRGLFYNTTSNSISLLKTATSQRDFEFGVLPIPVYNEGDDYCCTVNRYQSSVIGIPTCCQQIEAAAFLLEALGYYSDNVTNAYYQLTLQLQALDEDADAEMLDIVYSSKYYDLGSIFPWGNLLGLYGSVISSTNSNELASKYDAMSSQVEADIEATLQQYKEMN